MIPSVVAGTLARSVEDFLRATFPVSTPAMTGLLDGLFARGGMFKGPYLSIDLPHRLAEDGGEPFPEVPLGYQPYLHQHAAFERLGGPAPQSTIVATGTGSGKTECFLLPILEHCRHRRALGESGIKAILIYPMNALATDQAKRVARRVHDTPSLRGKITAALYVGDSEHEPHAVMSRDSVVTNRDAIRDSPPDILLTNYKMLDYLLIRPRDRRLWRNNGPETLRFVVVDELHSFDGAQGTDLACLLRRLKARLGTSAGYLACVGTSATLGTAENREELRAYAGRIFGENFNAGAVIGEQRQSVGEFLEDVFTSTLDVPAPTEELCAASHDGLESYLRAQHRLWFGAEIPADFADPDWRCALAEQWLKPLPFFQNLLKVLGGRPRGIDAILAELARRTTLPAFPPEHPTYHADLVESVAALVSAARSPTLPGSKEKTRPFLNVRDQLWIRELRRMVSSVGTAPVLRFSDDLSDRERASYLPIVHCLDCASTGWASLLSAGESTLRSDLREFYIAFFGRDPRVTFLFPTEAVGEPRIGFEKGHTRLLCGNCLTLGADPDAGRCGSCGHRDALTRVFVPDNKRSVDRRNGTTRLEGDHDCPFCRSRNGLTVLGSQAASLISVMLGSLFATPFAEEDDRQVIAFSDSVQDAAHRAGFFGARTYRLNFRTALQRASEAAGEGTSLGDLTVQTAHFWQDALGDDARYVGTFLPADLEWLHGWTELKQTGKLGNHYDLLGIVNRRVAWEVMSEHGLRARLGRTLERAGVSTLRPDPGRLDNAVEALLPVFQNEVGGLRTLSRECLRAFLMGLLLHLRQQGGILHPFLDEYISQSGNTYLLGRPTHMPRFGPASRAPGFYTDGAVPRSSFERVLSGSGNRTWCAGWTSACFIELEPLVGEYLDRIVPPALSALVRAGLLEERRTTRGDHRVWGLRPDALLLSLNVERLRCTRCHHEIAAAADEVPCWEAAPCLRLFCGGTYASDRSDDQAYYRSLYGHGRVRRVVAREHTGLLDRDVREAMEQRFIAAGRGEGWPWDPNVLSATSTLELGVDIGELSTVLLCSVPPTTANYIQRVGRSGRRDGNALNVAVANGRPHDLYFFSAPEEILGACPGNSKKRSGQGASSSIRWTV